MMWSYGTAFGLGALLVLRLTAAETVDLAESCRGDGPCFTEAADDTDAGSLLALSRSSNYLGSVGLLECLHKTGARILTGSSNKERSEEFSLAIESFSMFFQSYPIAVAQPHNENEVSLVLKCGERHRIRVTPKGGGHSNEGAAVVTGGVVLDFAASMNATTLLDDGETALVQAGATMGAMVYDLWMQSHGKRSIPVGQKASVGTGLILGGGFGFNTRLYGLSCDYITSLRLVTAAGDIIVANASNEHKGLFWANCGGGGGNFAVVTEFTMRTFDCSQNVTMFEYQVLTRVDHIHVKKLHMRADIVDFYQQWSMRMDIRATPNMENWYQWEELRHWGVKGKGYTIVGWFWGSPGDFDEALTRSGLTEDTLLKKSRFTARSVSMLTAILALSGWTDETDHPSVLLGKFREYRNFYKYQSFWLMEPLPREAVEIMVKDAPWYTDDDGPNVIFEFQSIGADNGSQVSAIGPTATAFANRNARHCLMFKSWGKTYEQGIRAQGHMNKIYRLIAPFVKGRGAYVNHLDSTLTSPEDAYFGLHDYPQSNDDPAFGNSTIRALTKVAMSYNPRTALTKVQPCCGPQAQVIAS